MLQPYSNPPEGQADQRVRATPNSACDDCTQDAGRRNRGRRIYQAWIICQSLLQCPKPPD